MPLRSFIWNRRSHLLILSLLGTSAQSFASSDFQYFGEKIDYWNPPTLPKSEPTSSSQVPAKPFGELKKFTSEKFDWAKYLDPDQKDFFREGDYTPPEPFLEIVRNPSDENLKLWFSYIDKKNALSKRLQERMQEYLAKQGPAVPEIEASRVIAKAQALPQSAPDARRFRFRLYFDSKCPHCHRMMGTLQNLQAQGFLVEARQVDNDPSGLVGLPIPAERAAPGEVQAKEIQSVPLLLIGDLKKQVVYRLTGFQSPAQVLAAIQTQSSSP